MTVTEAIVWAMQPHKNSLSVVSVSLERRDAEAVLLHVIDKTAAFLRTWPDFALSDEQVTQYQSAIMRLSTGEPLAYVLGEQAFWTLTLQVTPDTLIPRPDTERLVEAALVCMAAAQGRVLDLGTGSGAIALSLASERPAWQVLASDFSAAALAVARSNAIKNSLSNCEFRCGSWFDVVDESEKFDLIVSNPPYIDPDDTHLAALTHEPITALTAQQQGLADLRQIVAGAGRHLLDAGWLLVEHGYDQGLIVRELFTQAGFVQVDTLRDYGGNERVTLGQWVV
ncbi:MAG: peptide chain release factor N(5)-glutamine methyltransferase [Moraxellaceae bacterium]